MKHWSIRGFLALTACAALLSGCGPSLSYTVSPELIKRLPKSSRRSVFQAETVVTIAVDRKSSVKRQIDNARREIDRTEERIKKARKEAEGAAAREAEKIDMEIDMLDAKIDFLNDKIDHLEMSLKLAEMELVLAKAQFELAKVKLVKKHSIAFSDSEEDFVEQAKSIQADVDDMRKDVDEDAADLKRKEESWLAVKKKYFSSIGESSKGWWTE
jgi:chromosome segregation ATPase